MFYWSVEALMMGWLGLRYRRRYVWGAALCLFVAAFVKLFATEGVVGYSPTESFRLLLNNRALAFAALGGALGVSAVLFKRLRDPGEELGELVGATLHYAWCLLVFVLVTVETNDLFTQRMVGASGQEATALDFNRSMLVGAIWLSYSLALVYTGVARGSTPVVHCGIASVALAAGMLMIRGSRFEPIASFRVGLNLRAAALLFGLAALLTHAFLLRKRASRMLTVAGALLLAWCVLLVVLVTAEANDYFRLIRIGAASEEAERLGFLRDMTFCVLWIGVSLGLVWYGLRKTLPPFLFSGLAVAALAVCVSAIRGFEFEPIERFALVTNPRVAAMLGVTVGAIVLTAWLKRKHEAFGWTAQVSGLLAVVVALLIFDLTSAETRDFFEKAIVSLGDRRWPEELSRLRNLQQMWLSLVWLVYSILLMAYGIFRNRPALRILAIVLFGVSILKIFIYDLSFLETLYRIFSFIVLGLILLAASFLYQRFKSVIFDVGPKREQPES